MQGDTFVRGRRVTVIQQIPQRDEVWTARTTGIIEKFEQKKTGSWFAHAKDDKLWLDRLTVRKDDGEIVVFVLDRYTHVDIHPPPPEAPPEAPPEVVPSEPAVEDDKGQSAAEQQESESAT